jgi:hypothetical protein
MLGFCQLLGAALPALLVQRAVPRPLTRQHPTPPHPLGWHLEACRGAQPPRFGHLLWVPGDGAPAGRARGQGAPPRVWARRGEQGGGRRGRRGRGRGWRGGPVCGASGEVHGVDVAWRQDPRVPAGLCARGHHAGLRVCGRRQHGAPQPPLWPAVPPRGGAHAAGQGHPGQLCGAHLRRHAGLVHGLLLRWCAFGVGGSVLRLHWPLPQLQPRAPRQLLSAPRPPFHPPHTHTPTHPSLSSSLPLLQRLLRASARP